MAIARIYQNGQWVPVNQGSPELVSHDYLERELSFKADFDHNHDDRYSSGAELIHDHARPTWSGTDTRTTSFTCPTNRQMLLLQLSNLGHANASGIWDYHFYMGTTSGGSELLSLGGLTGVLGYGAGTGCYYPLNGTYCVPITSAVKGQTLYVTSYAPAGNYYLSGEIKVYAT